VIGFITRELSILLHARIGCLHIVYCVFTVRFEVFGTLVSVVTLHEFQTATTLGKLLYTWDAPHKRAAALAGFSSSWFGSMSVLLDQTNLLCSLSV